MNTGFTEAGKPDKIHTPYYTHWVDILYSLTKKFPISPSGKARFTIEEKSFG